MKKHRIYTDEVGNPDLKNSDDLNHRFLCLSGVIFDLEYALQTFHPELEKLKAKYFEHHPDEPLIFHRKELVFKEGKFRILKNPDLEKSFNQDLLGLLKKWDFKIISSIIDKKRILRSLPNMEQRPLPPMSGRYSRALSWLSKNKSNSWRCDD